MSSRASPKQKRIFVTDCEGPISINDNAFELSKHFIPEGDHLFTAISRYDDILSDLAKRSNYKAGNTLKLILPFLKAYEVTNKRIGQFSLSNLLLVPGAKYTIKFVQKNMPSYIVSTSYEQYLKELCNTIKFPMERVYCTSLNIDKYKISMTERKRLKMLADDIKSRPFIEIPRDAKNLVDIEPEGLKTLKMLDKIFGKEILSMEVGKMLLDVNPIGGYEKAEAVKEICARNRSNLSETMYVGDSITDVEAFRKVREGGGLTVSFNGNKYAIREADLAVASNNTITIGILAEVFRKYGKKEVLNLMGKWNYRTILNTCDWKLTKKLESMYLDSVPVVEKITSENEEKLISKCSVMRRIVRGEAIGNLG